MYFRSYTLWKSSSDHSVKSTVWEHAFNMWKWPEYLRNLHESPFIVFFHHSERSWFGKCLHLFYLKSYGSLLTHWLPMASILFKIVRICNSQFKSNYVGNQEHFLNVLFHFRNLQQILNILKENIIVIANVFPKLQTVKNFVRRLCKKRHFETRFDSQHVKLSRILAKPPWVHLYHLFSSFWGKLIWKISALVWGHVLGVFVNTLTDDGKYPVKDCENLPLPIQMESFEKRKTFSEFFAPFLESTWNFKHFDKRDDHYSYVFLKLQAVKLSVRPLCKRHRIRKRFDSQHVIASKILAKSLWYCFYHVFSSLAGNLILKMSPLLMGEIFRVYVNTLTADGKYPVQYCENLQLPIQMQLSYNWKTFSEFFVPFLDSTWYFKHFEKKGGHS